MLNDLPLPDGKPTAAWARRVLRLWAKAGWPVLIGNAAEKVNLAKGVLNAR